MDPEEVMSFTREQKEYFIYFFFKKYGTIFAPKVNHPKRIIIVFMHKLPTMITMFYYLLKEFLITSLTYYPEDETKESQLYLVDEDSVNEFLLVISD